MIRGGRLPSWFVRVDGREGETGNSEFGMPPALYQFSILNSQFSMPTCLPWLAGGWAGIQN